MQRGEQRGESFGRGDKNSSGWSVVVVPLAAIRGIHASGGKSGTRSRLCLSFHPVGRCLPPLASVIMYRDQVSLNGGAHGGASPSPAKETSGDGVETKTEEVYEQSTASHPSTTADPMSASTSPRSRSLHLKSYSSIDSPGFSLNEDRRDVGRNPGTTMICCRPGSSWLDHKRFPRWVVQAFRLLSDFVFTYHRTTTRWSFQHMHISRSP